ELLSMGNNVKEVYEVQTRLISEIEGRIKQPSKYQMRANMQQYKKAENNVKEDRAKLVVKHRDNELSEYKIVATTDLKQLQKLNPDSQKFSSQLILLKKAHFVEEHH
ncbi:MAG TPA: hypothetical protein VMZ69_10010, partial [Saprospiraceae bacterium]|nr:hypothetical protein [Saprospiraceae bacterium]